MMISVAPKITDAGRNLQIRAIGGETITFTRFKIGNGETGEAEPATMLDLINPLVDFAIKSIDTSETGYVKLTGTFDNTNITSDFRWRELGVFCKGEDGVEVLYAYANDGENAGLLKVHSTNVVTEQSITLVIAVGDAENVTAILSGSALYASKTEFDAHIANKENPHEVTKTQVGLGNVPNVATNDQTPTYSMELTNKALTSGEKLSVAFGKLSRIVKSVIAHIANTNNPHKNTANGIGAANKEHTHSAGDINSGIISINRGGTGANTPEKAIENLGIPIKLLEGKTVNPMYQTPVTAGEGATIIGDIRHRGYVAGADGVYVASGGNVATGKFSVALGKGATSVGSTAISAGDNPFANGVCAIALGMGTYAGSFNTVAGKYNIVPSAGTFGGTPGDAFVIGNGTGESSRSNAFRVTFAGNVYGLSAFGSSGADYAEYFEWQDGNTNNEDRRGLFVTLDEGKIRKATAEDTYILGIISGNPCFAGDVQSELWQGQWLTDVFGEKLTEIVEVPETTDEETGEVIPAHTVTRWILNPEFDTEQEYVSRDQRKEWSAVGLVGKLIVTDDGTCEVNGYCKVGVDGKGTKSTEKTAYRVMNRVDDTHVRVFVKS